MVQYKPKLREREKKGERVRERVNMHGANMSLRHTNTHTHTHTHTWHMKFGMMRWNEQPLYPMPFSPVHSARKFSA